MRFSIRTVLGLTFLAALGALAWNTMQHAQRNQAHAQQLRSETQTLEALLHRRDPARHQARLHELDQYEALRAMRAKAIRQFGRLREKYGVVEPRGPDVLSMRNLPSLAADGGPSPVVFRLSVPSSRRIFLKAGVHASRAYASTSSEADDLDFLTESAYQLSGPFEMLLPAGDHTLSIARGAIQAGAQRLRITLDDEVLLETAFVADQLTGGGSSSISAPVQIDYEAGQPLPLLVSLKNSIEHKASTAADTPEFSVWLSGQSSGFSEFPRHDT